MKIGGTIETYTFLIQKIIANTTKKSLIAKRQDFLYFILINH